MIDPKIKKDEVILLDSDQSPSEVHENESKKKRQTRSKDETVEKLHKSPVHERKTKKRVKANSLSRTKVLKRKVENKNEIKTIKYTSKHEMLKEELSAEDLEILNEASCDLGDSSIMIPKELKQTCKKTISPLAKETVSKDR